MFTRSVTTRLVLLIAAVVLLAMTACVDGVPVVRFSKNPYAATVGQSVTLELIGESPSTGGCSLNAASSGAQVPQNENVGEWSVEPISGAVVDDDGVFTATEAGSYTVTAIMKGGGGTFSTVVEVTAPTSKSVYDNHNDGAVYNGGKPASFELDVPTTVTAIEDYHYGEGKGTPGGGTIGLIAEDGTIYGPWTTQTADGQGGVPNAYWTATPNVVLPPGKYTIQDSDPRTWSQNEGSAGFGMTRISGAPAN
ncbi:MAG: hypothetical protein ACYC77_09845 [Coriobacteriia bacterium]